ncbi:MAG: hypothetical protein LJE57_00475 [Gallionella sp.]|nr:hypothetical protein [Gallionella sp.]
MMSLKIAQTANCSNCRSIINILEFPHFNKITETAAHDRMLRSAASLPELDSLLALVAIGLELC